MCKHLNQFTYRVFLYSRGQESITKRETKLIGNKPYIYSFFAVKDVNKKINGIERNILLGK